MHAVRKKSANSNVATLEFQVQAVHFNVSFISGKLGATATIKTHLFTGFNSSTTFKQDTIFVKLIFVSKAM